MFPIMTNRCGRLVGGGRKVRNGKQARLLALILASLWIGAGWSRGQGAAHQTQHLDASAEEHVRQLIASLPRDSMWRNMLEHDMRGDGIRQPWMNQMRKDGVKLAIFTYEFAWTDTGRNLKNWTLVDEQYFRDYDHSQPISEQTELDLIRRDGLP